MEEVSIIKGEGRFGIGINADSLAFLEFIHKCLKAERKEIQFDLSDISFVYPIGIVVLAGLSIYLDKYRGKEIKILFPNNKEVKNYLIESKFAELGGIESELNGAYIHNGRLMVELKQLFKTDQYSCEKLIDLIKNRIEMSPYVSNRLFESIIELEDNVFQHSETKEGCLIMGQSFPDPKSNRIRISILDLGIGIKTHLSRKLRDLHGKNDFFAIIKALEPGVTGSMDIYKNSGQGLSFINEFVEKCDGCLTIISNKRDFSTRKWY